MLALAPWALGLSGLLIGFVAGYATRRARLCTFGAVEDVVAAGDWRRLKVFALALAVAAVCAQTLVAFGLLDPQLTTYAHARLPWLGVIVGALAFGLGMALVGTCAFGSLIRLGGGDLRALVTLGVFGLMALAWLRGALAPLRLDGFERIHLDVDALYAALAGPVDPPAGLGLLIAGLACAGLLGLIARDKRLWRAPRLLTGGLALGLCVGAGWLVTGVLADPFADTRVQSLTFVAPVARFINALAFSPGDWADFGVASVLGVALGAFAHALAAREFHWEAFDDSREMRRHLLGAALMGAGGVLAGGCTIGQGLSAGSLLSSTWPLAVAGMVIGARFGILLLVEGPLREVVASRMERLRQSRAFRR